MSARRREEQLGFVLHRLGDFIYEIVWYPEGSTTQGMYDRRLRDIVHVIRVWGEVSGFAYPYGGR